MKPTKWLVLFLCAISVASAKDPAKAKAEDDIREATFRYEFLHNASSLQQEAGVFFLSIGIRKGQEGDPGDALIRRFVGHKPIVQKASRAKAGIGGLIQDKETGELGIIFYARKIKWIDDTHVEVEGGCYEGPAIASSNTYYLEKRGGYWAVTKEKMSWVS
jgi:hypothetical protein